MLKMTTFNGQILQPWSSVVRFGFLTQVAVSVSTGALFSQFNKVKAQTSGEQLM